MLPIITPQYIGLDKTFVSYIHDPPRYASYEIFLKKSLYYSIRLLNFRYILAHNPISFYTYISPNKLINTIYIKVVICKVVDSTPHLMIEFLVFIKY